MASITHTGPFVAPNPHLGSTVRELVEETHAASIRIRGSLCAITASEHGRLLAELVDRGYIQLRIELDDLTLCTSDGLDLWDELQHRLDPVAGRVTLTGAHGVVRRVLDVVQRPEGHFCPTVEPSAA
jgi:excinuclease UvrABC ATPase subunit